MDIIKLLFIFVAVALLFLIIRGGWRTMYAQPRDHAQNDNFVAEFRGDFV